MPDASNADGFISYHVQSGDTLYAIAKKYPGVTVQSIQKANGLSTTRLRIGQILKIPQG
jgi:membrane-bound lytic murein transglycosylase D